MYYPVGGNYATTHPSGHLDYNYSLPGSSQHRFRAHSPDFHPQYPSPSADTWPTSPPTSGATGPPTLLSLPSSLSPATNSPLPIIAQQIPIVGLDYSNDLADRAIFTGGEGPHLVDRPVSPVADVASTNNSAAPCDVTPVFPEATATYLDVRPASIDTRPLSSEASAATPDNTSIPRGVGAVSPGVMATCPDARAASLAIRPIALEATMAAPVPPTAPQETGPVSPEAGMSTPDNPPPTQEGPVSTEATAASSDARTAPTQVDRTIAPEAVSPRPEHGQVANTSWRAFRRFWDSDGDPKGIPPTHKYSDRRLRTGMDCVRRRYSEKQKDCCVSCESGKFKPLLVQCTKDVLQKTQQSKNGGSTWHRRPLKSVGLLHLRIASLALGHISDLDAPLSTWAWGDCSWVLKYLFSLVPLILAVCNAESPKFNFSSFEC